MAMIQKKMIAIVQKKSHRLPLNIEYLRSRELDGKLRQRVPIVRHPAVRARTALGRAR
jgi:hypothetical protein